MTESVKIKGYFLDNKDDTRIESLWCEPWNGNYKIENIPFFIKGVSWEDYCKRKTY